MNKRRQIILSKLDLSGVGLEIGASHNPLAPKKEGFNVEIIDHLDRAGLREKYANDASVCLENIEEVDYVWKGETYAELTGKQEFYDWIIASHVIEHVPDLVSFLRSCAEVLKPGGILTLAVPDLRYCFDQLRPPSGLAKVLDSFHNKNTKPSPGDVMESYLNSSKKSGKITWSSKTKGQDMLVNSQIAAQDVYRKSLLNADYSDVHTWCFTPNSFRLIMHDLALLGLVPFQEVDFDKTRSFEFYVALQKTDQFQPGDRLELLLNSKKDLYEPFLAGRNRWKRWF